MLPPCVEGQRWIVADIDPDMNMGGAPEVPDKGGAFQSPVVPFPIIAEVAFLVEGQAAHVETALPLQTGQGLGPVLLPIRLDERLEDVLQLVLLIGTQLGDRDAWMPSLG